MLGFPGEELLTMSDMTFSARTIGAFLREAVQQADGQCKVIDYTDLNLSALEATAELFGITVTDEGRDAMRATLGVYSKDPRGERLFADDPNSKQNKATDMLRREVDEWARTPYELLQRQAVSVESL